MRAIKDDRGELSNMLRQKKFFSTQPICEKTPTLYHAVIITGFNHEMAPHHKKNTHNTTAQYNPTVGTGP